MHGTHEVQSRKLHGKCEVVGPSRKIHERRKVWMRKIHERQKVKMRKIRGNCVALSRKIQEGMRRTICWHQYGKIYAERILGCDGKFLN